MKDLKIGDRVVIHAEKMGQKLMAVKCTSARPKRYRHHTESTTIQHRLLERPSRPSTTQFAFVPRWIANVQAIR